MPIIHKATLPLCRPGEPSFMKKMNYRFDIPAEHLSPRYKEIGFEVLENSDDENIQKLPVKSLHKYPNLNYVQNLDKNATFSVFQHMNYAKALIKILDGAQDLDELISLALYCRDQVNSQLFVYSYMVVLLHRHDTINIEMPQFIEISPKQFFKKDIMTNVRKTLFQQEKKRETRDTGNHIEKSTPKSTIVPFRGTMSAANREEKLNFFREDLGVNSHHFHWHLVYPFDGPDPKYYDKDRRGELFYFMHHQMLNWYNCNRLAMQMQCVKPFENFREMINEGYYSNLTAATSSYNIPPRQDNTYLQDLLRDSNFTQVKVSDLERWYFRIHESIDNGYCVDVNGNKINLINNDGINILMNMIEANSLSPNYAYYGNLHNMGHNIISLIHDPMMRHNEPPGVMSDTTTAMRDPIFYRWHKMIDELCVKLKNRLPPYEPSAFQFNGITIESFVILNEHNQAINQLFTYWQRTTVNIEHGLDFHVPQPSLITITHLNYVHFTYSIQVRNDNLQPKLGTVRIYLLPFYDEAGNPFLFEGCRKLAIEIDRFLIKFPPGLSVIKRKSTDSSVTIPFERTFPMQQDEKTVLMSGEPENVRAVCMCGWPQHLLMPKGAQDGYPFRFYIMISDYNMDKVDQNPSNGVCSDNYIMCGLQNRKYPDKRSMGFPFDRVSNSYSFEEFVQNYKNMSEIIVVIKHQDENKAQIGDNPKEKVSL